MAEYEITVSETLLSNLLSGGKEGLGELVESVLNQLLESSGGKVRLLRWKEYHEDWDPTRDDRIPVWEVLQHMICRLISVRCARIEEVALCENESI